MNEQRWRLVRRVYEAQEWLDGLPSGPEGDRHLAAAYEAVSAAEWQLDNYDRRNQ